MRIWYQSLVEEGSAPGYFTGMVDRARTIGRPDTTVTLHGVPAGTYGKYSPAEVAAYPYLASLHTQFILDNALRAESEGYDAFAVGSVQEPGLEEARSLVDIAVVGYGESAMHIACSLGSRFAVLVFQSGFEQIMDLRVRRLGLTERALPTKLIDASFEDISRGMKEPRLLVERFTEAARQAIGQGAEALIPGQLYLSEAIARAGLTRIDDVPIIDGLAATLKTAEMMVDLKRLGISVTRRGYTHARPRAELIEHARRVHSRPAIPARKP